ncbi:secretion protein HlyD family protein [Opitutaceae bacterium TAV5]|nr:secretion protein HlyD family protein [Opitutaceae bacterium TAV5]
MAAQAAAMAAQAAAMVAQATVPDNNQPAAPAAPPPAASPAPPAKPDDHATAPPPAAPDAGAKPDEKAGEPEKSGKDTPAEKDGKAKKDETPPGKKGASVKKKVLVSAAIAAVVIVIAVLVWSALKPSGPGEGFVSGNGRIEATGIDIAAKLAGRIHEMMVNEGDFVQAGQPLAQMQVDVLEAQRNEARAQSRQATSEVASAEAQVAARQSDTAAARAVVVQRESELDAAQRRLARSETLSRAGAMTIQEFDDDRARVDGAVAALTAAQAQVVAAAAAVRAAEAQVVGAVDGVAAAEATVARVEADIRDSLLASPRDGRVQYRVAQPGEVLAAGGKVLNLVDLGDVYMTFFLPETVVGRLALGSPVHIVLDAAPQYVIPASVSYVSAVAQFTPKTVETASERQKLMFRVKAQIDPALLKKHVRLVKTGLPGVAWLKLDAQAAWPADLEIRVPE